MGMLNHEDIKSHISQEALGDQQHRIGSKKSVRQGHSHVCARRVLARPKHKKMAGTPLAAFFNRPTMYPLLLLIIGIMMWPSQASTAMFRCYDQVGSQILTDNPAQLTDCIQLKSSIISSSQEYQNLPQPAPAPDALPAQGYSEYSEPQTSEQHNQGPHSETDLNIPLEKIGGSFIAQAILNKGRAARLIVDTGASMTVLSTNIAIDLGILGTTDNELLTVNTAGGSVQVNMNYLRSLNVGEAEAQHVAVAIHDLPDIPEQIDGLLGMSFLKHFLVTLDAEHSRLILRSKPTP